MKLTKNQEAIKEFGKSVGVFITTNNNEKQSQWDNTGEIYECDQCGKVRQIGEPWEETYICYKCFNAHKLPWMSYNTSIYSNWYIGNKLLDWFKNDKPIEKIKVEFNKIKVEVIY